MTNNMGTLLRKARGIVGTALGWAGSWAVVGLGLHALAVALGWPGFFGGGLIADLAAPAILGFGSGALFATGFALTEGRRRLDRLSVWSGAMWGMLGGALGPIAMLMIAGSGPGVYALRILPFFIAAGVLGAASGAAMVAIARSGEDDTDRIGPSDPDGILPASGS